MAKNKIWLPVKSAEGYYEVSSCGLVRSVAKRVRFLSKKGGEFFRFKKERIIYQQKINSGYLACTLSVDGKKTAKTVHSIVAEAFIGPRPKGFDICHKNGNRLDNRASNLRYDTRKNNHADMKRHGTYYLRITANKLSISDVKKIRASGHKTQDELAKKFKVTVRTIRKVRKRILWTHV